MASQSHGDKWRQELIAPLGRKGHSVTADDVEQLRRNAEACRRLAAIEASEDDKSYWLRQADEWQRLAAKTERGK